MTAAPPGGPRSVLMVTPRFYPDAGGIQTHVREVGERLTGMGVRVTVLTTDATGLLASDDTIGSLTVRRVRAWPRNRDYYLAPGIWNIVTGEPWDIVHCQGVHTFVAPMAMAAARQARTRYMVTFHTGGHSTRLRHRFRALQWRGLQPLLSRACRLVAVSRFEAELFGAAIRPRPGRLVVIPNGVTPMTAPPVPDRAADTIILSIGRLERYKGHQRLIAAMPALIRHIPNVRATILGTGPYEGALKRLASKLGVVDRVTITSVPAGQRDEMASHIRRAALVVLLSEYEAHPVALLEAASANTPVLVARTSGLTELVEDGLAYGIELDAPVDATAQAIASAVAAPRPNLPPALPTWDDTAKSLLAQYEACLSPA